MSCPWAAEEGSCSRCPSVLRGSSGASGPVALDAPREVNACAKTYGSRVIRNYNYNYIIITIIIMIKSMRGSIGQWIVMADGRVRAKLASVVVTNRSTYVSRGRQSTADTYDHRSVYAHRSAV